VNIFSVSISSADGELMSAPKGLLTGLREITFCIRGLWADERGCDYQLFGYSNTAVSWIQYQEAIVI
jgi:hypothetical protein